MLEKKAIWEAEVDYKLHLSLDLREFFQSWIARALLPEQNHVCTWCSAVSSIRTPNRQRICPLDFASNGRTLTNRWKTSLRVLVSSFNSHRQGDWGFASFLVSSHNKGMIVLYSTARAVWRDSSTFYIYNMFIHTNIPAKTNQHIINPFPVINPATLLSALCSATQFPCSQPVRAPKSTPVFLLKLTSLS